MKTADRPLVVGHSIRHKLLLNHFRSDLGHVILITLLYVEVFIFLISLVKIGYLML